MYFYQCAADFFASYFQFFFSFVFWSMYEFCLRRYSRCIGLELDEVAACERPDVHIRLILNDNDYKTQMLCVADRSLCSVLFDAKSPTVINLYVMCAKTVLTHSVHIHIFLIPSSSSFQSRVCVYACANLCILCDTWWYVCFMVLWLAVKYTQIYNHQLNKRNNLADFACT